MAPATNLDIPHILSLRWSTRHTISPHQIISYNLALGASGSSLPDVYEGHPQFQPLPTFAAIFAIQAMGQVHTAMHDFLPNFKPHNHVHGEHFLQLHRPYPKSGTVTTTARVVDVVARKKGVLVAVEIITMEGLTGRKICTQEWTSFVLQVPGNGASEKAKERGRRTLSYKMPDRKPDEVRTHRATAEQGALYRAASGDLNPLHIDPETARKAGFPKPILTGTCTIGVGVRQVLEAVEGRFGSVKCRLSRPVFAGDEVRTDMWRVGEGKVVYRMVVVEEGGRERVVIDGAGLDLVEMKGGKL